MVTHNTLRTYEVKQVFLKMNLKFVTAIDLNKYLKRTRLPILLYTCAPIAELPFSMSTMIGRYICVYRYFYTALTLGTQYTIRLMRQNRVHDTYIRW
mgnify:CR=1 FL=1